MSNNRPAPPPVSDPNPPRRPQRQAPADDGNAVARHEPDPVQHHGVTASVTNVGTNVGNQVPHRSGPPPSQALAALLHGRVNPEDDRAQTGVRLPRYVADAVRVIAATSKGKANMQDIVTAAVKAYVPADVLHASWINHGGDTAEQAGQ